MGQQLAKSCPSHDRSLYKPQGVHKLDNIDLRKLKKLIKARRIAPFWEQKDQDQDGREECPICNYWYPAINTASCCGARLCTECFVMCQSSHDPPGKAGCPYCKKVPFSVRYLGCKSEEQLRRERMEGQIVAEAKLRQLKEYAISGSQRSQQQQSSSAGSAAELLPRQPSIQSLQCLTSSEPGWLDDVVGPRDSSSAAYAGGRSIPAAAAHAAGRLGPSSLQHTVSVYAEAAGVRSRQLQEHQQQQLEQRQQQQQGERQHWLMQQQVQERLAAQWWYLPAERQPQQQQQQQQLQLVPSCELLNQQQQPQQQPVQQQQQWIHQLEQQQAQQQHQAEQQQQQQAELADALFESEILPGYLRQELAGLTAEEMEEIMLEQALIASLQQAAAVEAAALGMVAQQLPAWASGAAAEAAASTGAAATRAAAS